MAYKSVDDPDPLESYSVFGADMAHPADRVENLREFHDDFMIDLQPSKDAAHADRLQREREQIQRRHDRMRARYEEHGEIRKFVKEV